MDKKEVAAFFDRCAPKWDAEMIRSDQIIGVILDNAGVTAGMRVLDIACGTGVLMPDYLARNVQSVTGIDISPAMADIAVKKFANEPRVTIVNGDAESFRFDTVFDCIIIYNAFPHFADPAALFDNLSKYLAPGGSLTVAHGMSRDKIGRHHAENASKVSVGLLHEDELAALLAKYVAVDTVISNDEMYQVSGKRG